MLVSKKKYTAAMEELVKANQDLAYYKHCVNSFRDAVERSERSDDGPIHTPMGVVISEEMYQKLNDGRAGTEDEIMKLKAERSWYKREYTKLMFELKDRRNRHDQEENQGNDPRV